MCYNSVCCPFCGHIYENSQLDKMRWAGIDTEHPKANKNFNCLSCDKEIYIYKACNRWNHPPYILEMYFVIEKREAV